MCSTITKRSNTQLPFWMLSVSIIIGLSLPILIQEGMFQDGLLYTCVARNLSEGIGNFWFLQYSTLNLEGIPSFHEQPPLIFGIQSIFFWIFGDSMYVERGYTFVMLLLHFYLINVLWKIAVSEFPQYRNYGWLPVFFFAITPVCFWSFRHNMIENSMSIFTLLSVIVGYRSLKQNDNGVLVWVLAGIFIFLATLSKGVPGLFPLVVPAAYSIATRHIKWKNFLLPTVIMIAVVGTIYSILLLFPNIRESLSIYFYDRLIRRVDSMPTVDHRYSIIVRLFFELIPSLVAVSLLLIFRKKTRIFDRPNMNSDILFFILMGFAGSLPLTLTMVQKSWYMFPSFPFFSMAFALMVIPIVERMTNRFTETYPISFLWFSRFCIALFIGVFIFSITKIGGISRDSEIIGDVKEIGKVVPPMSTIGLPEGMYDQYDFILQGYLVRYCHISLDPYTKRTYFITYKTTVNEAPSDYKQIDIPLRKYALFKVQ